MIEIDGREYRTAKEWENVKRRVTDKGRRRGVTHKWNSPAGWQRATYYPKRATRALSDAEIRREKREAAERAAAKRAEEEAREHRAEVSRARREGGVDAERSCLALATSAPKDVIDNLCLHADSVHSERGWLRRGFSLIAGGRELKNAWGRTGITCWDARWDPERASATLGAPMMGRAISLDCETTGLNPYNGDEILSLSICDAETGEEIWDRMYRPEHAEEWPEAEAINGISPAMVEGCPNIAEDADKVRAILDTAGEIIIYNAEFDLSFLRAAGLMPHDEDLLVTDTMLEFAEAYGEWSSYFNGWKWQKLVTAADYIGYRWDGEAHYSLADARASAAVWRWLKQRVKEVMLDDDEELEQQKIGGMMTAECRQSMSAVVCVYPSGQIDLVSMHHSTDAAYDYLERMRETGEAENWRGTLVIVPGADADVYGILDHPKLLKWLDFLGIEYRED